MVSPNSPPRPKECGQEAGGTWVEAKTAATATAMGAKMTRDRARSAPRWATRRRPQTRRISAAPQDACPAISVSGEAIEAPRMPSQFSGGASVRASHEGSSGE